MPSISVTDPTKDGNTPPTIRSIEVRRLFGRYSYAYDVPTQPDGSPAPLVLLYGDNGCGKTTLLRLIHNLLSPMDNRGHRTAIARIPFEFVEIGLSNGESIQVYRGQGELRGSFTVSVMSKTGLQLFEKQYHADHTLTVRASETDYLAILSRTERLVIDHHDLPSPPEDEFPQYLRERGFSPLFLHDERQVESDRWDFELRHPRHEREDMGSGAIALELVLRGASAAIRDMSIDATNSGTLGTNSVYLSVMRQLASEPDSLGDDELGRDRLMSELAEKAGRNNRYAKYGLLPLLQADDFRDALVHLPSGRVAVAETVLAPFLDGLEKRLDTLAPVFFLVDSLVRRVNEFFHDKEVRYDPRGLRVVSQGGETLEAEALSSGERHLLTILCSAVIARRQSTLFIIDEPEISLNVKWQRRLLPAMLDIAGASNVQFLVATHSIEVLASHRDSIFHMTDE